MRLRRLDRTLGSPAENLALDEALLIEHDREAAAGAQPAEWLRFWESPVHFVTLGVSGKLYEDVDVEACKRDGVPILRRASGGGTVLQGPGSLNYALVLSIDRRPELKDVTASYRVILERVAKAVELPRAAQEGTSDLAVAGVKFSGNAQKRTRHAVLHHGTLLWGFDLALLSRYLREPRKQPDYRARRTHGEFVRNLDQPPALLRTRLAAAWNAGLDSVEPRLPELSTLLDEKYLSREWTERF